MTAWRNPGVIAALAAAALFGAGAPAAKLLLGSTSPWLLAGLLYLGSGLGLALATQFRRTESVSLARGEVKWLAIAVATGGVIGPVLLMAGLSRMPASAASLLLNAEAVLTALLAWFVFHENFDRRIAFGMVLIVIGALVLSWPGEIGFVSALPALAVLGACFAWAIDNNLTRKIALTDATFIAMVKGLAAGLVNVAIAWILGATFPSFQVVIAACVVGFFSFGASLVLFVVALRHLGAARTGAYFSIAPFAGALISFALLGETVTATFVVAGLLMAAGVWLHLTERHEHQHIHDATEHTHEHAHDEHHQHEHDSPVPQNTRHTHRHSHDLLTHSHSHYPDAHHVHQH
jgi:drug/metabolite transporter (DMT)-like permease